MKLSPQLVLLVGLVAPIIMIGCVESPSPEGKTTPQATEKPNPRVPSEVTVSCLYIDRCLERLTQESEDELLSERAASIVLSAERTLPIFWGVDPQTLDEATRQKIDDYPAKIHEWIDRINEIKSQRTLREIQKILEEHDAWLQENQGESVPWQTWIDRDQRDVARIQKQLLGMSEGPSLEKASQLFAELQTQLNQHMRLQNTRYQKRALQRCHAFTTYVLTYTVINDSTLIEEFDKNEIAKIDAGLLGADARRIYDTAIGMMESKLKSRNRAEFLLKLTETEKWPLSDF
ncbi:MAG: hypothetical protein LC104_14165 [Bacteroidales bacterium]|nr:hypothetical protein [Bacteroidales bacterium]